MALVGLLIVWLLADRTFLLPQAGLTKPPTVLADKAEHIIKALGQQQGLEEHWQGFAIDRRYLQTIAQQQGCVCATGRSAAVCFWYRAGADQLALPELLGEPPWVRTFSADSGVVTVRLDGRGRLLQFLALPARETFANESSKGPDWSTLFEMAGLTIANFRDSSPVRIPPMYADSVKAWEGNTPRQSEHANPCRGSVFGQPCGLF